MEAYWPGREFPNRRHPGLARRRQPGCDPSQDRPNSQEQNGLKILVDTIATNKPQASIIIAQIMPKYTYQAGIVTYNNYIRDTLVPAQQALGRKVTLVDQYAPFLTDPADLTTIDVSLFSNGINYPSNPGYDKMARVWFAGIEALRIGPNTFSKWILDPAYGLDSGQRGFGDDPDGEGRKTALRHGSGRARTYSPPDSLSPCPAVALAIHPVESIYSGVSRSSAVEIQAGGWSRRELMSARRDWTRFAPESLRVACRLWEMPACRRQGIASSSVSRSLIPCMRSDFPSMPGVARVLRKRRMAWKRGAQFIHCGKSSPSGQLSWNTSSSEEVATASS
jgi:hypothetical protein